VTTRPDNDFHQMFCGATNGKMIFLCYMLPIGVDDKDTRAADRCRSEEDSVTAIGHAR